MQIDPSTLSRRDGYHLMISAIVPRAIAFVSTVGENGRTNAAPFSYFTGVSSSPPMLLICSSRRGEAMKDTHRNILATGEFVVNVVVPEIMDAVVIGGTDHPPEVSEIELANLAIEPGVKVRAPRLLDSPVNMECRLTQVTEVAGTAIIIGEIVWMHVREDLIVERRASSGVVSKIIDVARLNPIGRLDGDRYTTLGTIFERRRS